MDALDILHGIWRWVVLIAAVVSLIGAFATWFGALPLTMSVRRIGLPYIIALDIQVVIGIILWVGESWYSRSGFFAIEHPATMILALIVAHAGQGLIRRSKSVTGQARTLAIAYLISLLLVIIGIPGVVRGP
ncbi:MAG: hypothetical protein IT305_07085 [Chloroflexi bacterium]|nr:hypothetical protein [Chloroflexota bacterium]